MSESQQFVVDISDESKKLRELKYTLYIETSFHNSSTSNIKFILTNYRGINTYKESNIIVNSDIECQLLAAIEGINWVLEKYNQVEKSNIQLSIFTPNIYLSNIIREWLTDWSSNNFENRPYQHLLQKLYNTVNICKYNGYWCEKKN
jgi:hypothetical protein